MSRNWRQVRVFTNRFQIDWFHDLLWEVVKPWRQAKPESDYYFSRYISPLHGQRADNSDVGPNQLADTLPQDFREQRVPGPVAHHWSVRIRFAEDPPAQPAQDAGGGGEAALAGNQGALVAQQPAAAAAYGPVEASLRAILAQPHLQGRFWFPLFDTYDLKNDLGGVRFSSIPEANANARDDHGELVARILRNNCDLVMRSFSKVGQEYQIDLNQDGQNQLMGTSFQSVGHMLANVWWNRNGTHSGVWAMDSDRGIATQI